MTEDQLLRLLNLEAKARIIQLSINNRSSITEDGNTTARIENISERLLKIENSLQNKNNSQENSNLWHEIDKLSKGLQFDLKSSKYQAALNAGMMSSSSINASNLLKKDQLLVNAELLLKAFSDLHKIQTLHEQQQQQQQQVSTTTNQLLQVTESSNKLDAVSYKVSNLLERSQSLAQRVETLASLYYDVMNLASQQMVLADEFLCCKEEELKQKSSHHRH